MRNAIRFLGALVMVRPRRSTAYPFQHVGPTLRRCALLVLPIGILFLTVLPHTARADDFAYADFSAGGLFGVLNLNTGQFTPRGNCQGQCCVGMGQVASTLYGIGGPRDSGNYRMLYQINPANGNLS